MAWGAFSFYERVVPIARGKRRLASILRVFFGSALRKVSGIYLELNPWSDSDSFIGSWDNGTVIHQAMDEFLRPGSRFVDIGANIGFFSILAHAKYGCRCLAFEPSQRERDRLQRNATLNGATIDVRSIAVGRKDTKVILSLAHGDSHGKNRISSTSVNEGVECVMRRMDSLLADDESLSDIALIKIDVEGYEMEVLAGMEGLLEDLSGAAFVIEITPQGLLETGSSAEELYDFLQRRGWKARGAVRPNGQWDEIFEPKNGRVRARPAIRNALEASGVGSPTASGQEYGG
jgi:FkbM family methyltransferase